MNKALKMQNELRNYMDVLTRDCTAITSALTACWTELHASQERAEVLDHRLWLSMKELSEEQLHSLWQMPTEMEALIAMQQELQKVDRKSVV